MVQVVVLSTDAVEFVGFCCCADVDVNFYIKRVRRSNAVKKYSQTVRPTVMASMVCESKNVPSIAVFWFLYFQKMCCFL